MNKRNQNQPKTFERGSVTTKNSNKQDTNMTIKNQIELTRSVRSYLPGGPGNGTNPKNLTAIRRGIEETTHRFEDAFDCGDAAGAARQFYTRDARVLPPGAEMVQGRDRIAAFWAMAAAAPQMGVTQVELSTLDLQALGDEAYEIGRATLTLAGGQRATPKYVAVWKYEDDAWRRHVDIWNMDTP
jgi:uncharacterized protein (TIGR02246 family)